ncbi:hypothetical protein T01_15684 [Trichinella spiralis]|uniref:Uncharacterized protein n=1 Tax=Trichinella spiralis TaxID=6334 RepID=A0A0V1BTU9_TRISP|nr:hypothetical protein T01_15684 [Trichinella spiralis]
MLTIVVLQYQKHGGKSVIDLQIKTCRQTEILEVFKNVGCGGAVWTDLEVPAGIDRKDHVENCRVDEHMAYID